jgi:hypothetical protein
MGLLDAERPYELATSARLVLDLEELARVEWASLEFYATVRRIERLPSARRSLFRLKETLAEHGAVLEVKQRLGEISARFGTTAVRDLIEPDVRLARAVVERLEASREGRTPDFEGLADENDLVSPEIIRVEYRERQKSFKWICKKHGLGMSRLHRLVAATGPVHDRSRRRCVEEQRPESVVARALKAADEGARIEEIAAILECSARTAKRFVKRHGYYLPPGRPRES